ISSLGKDGTTLMEPGVTASVELSSGGKEGGNQPVNMACVECDNCRSTCSGGVLVSQFFEDMGMILFAHGTQIQARIGLDIQISRRQGWERNLGRGGCNVQVSTLFRGSDKHKRWAVGG